MSSINFDFINQLKWSEDGLIPVIAQDHQTNQVLMFAFMNKESLIRSVELGQAVYFSRSRNKLWHKGEESGHFQLIRELKTDCDNDVLLLKIEQVGNIACHTGRTSCFFNSLNFQTHEWEASDDVLKNPDLIYKK